MPEIITTAESTPYKMTQGNTLTSFPVVVAKCGGQKIDYTIVDERDPDAKFSVSEGTFTSNVPGKHIFKIKAVNPSDPTKVAESSFEIDVFRKLFVMSNSSVVEQWVGDPEDAKGNQYYRTTDKGNNVAIFNLSPSKKYYAEARFEGFSVLSTPDFFGMAHYSDLSNVPGLGVDKTRWLASAITTGNFPTLNGMGETALNIVSTVDEWSKVDNTVNGGCHYFRNYYKNGKNGIAGAMSVDQTFTYAVARDGAMFYSFINGELASAYSDPYYASVDTIPGIWGRLHNQSNAAGTAWNGKLVDQMYFVGGDDADSVLETKLAGMKTVKPWGSNFAADSIKSGSVLPGEYSDDKGVNFKCTVDTGWTNDNTATLNTAIDGNFVFQADYKASSYSGNILIDFRTSDWTKTILSAGLIYTGENAGNVDVDAGDDAWGTSVQSFSASEFDVTEGVTIKVTRTRDDTNAKSVYVVTMTSKKDKSMSVSKTIEDTTYPKTAVFPVMKNRKIKGEWTNISFAPVAAE